MSDETTTETTEKKTRARGPKLPSLTAEQEIMTARKIFRMLFKFPSTRRNGILRMVGEYAAKAGQPRLSVDVAEVDAGDEEFQ